MTNLNSAALDKTTLAPRRFFPYLALGIGVIGLSFSAIFVKWAGVPGAASGFYRMAIAAAVMAIPFGSQARQRRPLSRRHVWLAALGGLMFAGDLAAWNTGVLITSAANATLLGNTSPLWVSLGALIFFKEKLKPGFWAGLLLAMLGAASILGADFLAHPIFGIGDLLSLVAGFFYGAFFLVTQRAREGLRSLATWWIAAFSSAVVLFGLSLVLRQPLLGYSLAAYLNLAALALITQVGGYLLINYALGHLRASIVSPSLLMQPVLTAVWGMLLLNEPLSGLQIASGMVVIAGIYVVHRQNGP